MKRMLFFDRLFPTRSTSSVRGLVDRLFPATCSMRCSTSPHPCGSPTRAISRILAFVLLISAIGLITTGTAWAASWETSSMRAPGGGLIRIGMTRQEVLNELGQSQRARASTGKTAAGGKTGKQGGTLTYRGDDGLYTITFSGDRVARIVVTPRRD